MAEVRASYRCGGCGQTDDHPKLHYGQQQFHHDCIPAFVMDDLTSETTYQWSPEHGWVQVDRIPLADEDLHPAAQEMLKIVDKCKSGTKGAALLKFIQKED